MTTAVRKERKEVIRNIFTDDPYDMNENDMIRCIRENKEDENYEPTQDEIWDEWYFQNEICWECVERELNDFFDNGVFILIGYNQFWNGRFDAGSIIRSWNDITKSFRNFDCVKFYEVVKGGYGEFHFEGIHHDGTNHYVIRKLKDCGIDFLDRHEDDYNMSDSDLHKKLWNRRYSTNLNFTKVVWGL